MATPADLLTLQALVAELTEQVSSVQRENARLRHQLDAALHRLYGRKTERWEPPVPEQGQLPLASDAAQPEESAASQRRWRGRSAHRIDGIGAGEAPWRSHTHPAQSSADADGDRAERGRADVPRCTTAKTCIGSDVTEELDYTPAVLRVNEIVRPKYACPQCEDGVVQAPLPARPVDKGRPGPGLLAHVVTAKYADHLPLHRLEGIFGRGGLQVSRRTLCDWVAAVAEARRAGRKVLHAIGADVARRVLGRHADHGAGSASPGGSRQAYVWVYGGETRATSSTTSRRAAAATGPSRMLERYRGYLQADAYSGYETLFANGRIVEVGCWAHARRYVKDAVATALGAGDDTARADSTAVRASSVRRTMSDPVTRRARRQEQSQPVLDR